ncbi:PH domain-containing protein [Ditylenchus destructor]|nr:PH domain-containing protein [Ditylenchus destructor]
MDIRKVKEGYLQRYKSSFLSSKWKDCYAVLFSDSTMCLYNERGDSRPAETILMKNVTPFICVGMMCDRMPTRRPQLPSGVSVDRLVGIGMDPRAEKVHWLLFPSEIELENWFNELLSLLPKPANPPQQPMPNAQPSSGSYVPNQNTYVPPARYPDAPSPARGYVPPYAQPQQNAYGPPAQPPPAYSGYGVPQQTIIVDRLGGGLLLGSLLSHGIGSSFSPMGYGGMGYGGGFGSPFGGGYGGGGYGGGYQDNDTYITNNYYNSDDHGTGNVTDSTPHENAFDSSQATDSYNDDGGGIGGGFDDGGGFDGGFDGGGGDW